MNTTTPAERPDGNDAGVLRAMHAFQQGDESAFDEFSLAMWDRIRGKATARARRWRQAFGEEDAEDIAQKVLAKIYVHAAKATFEHVGQVFAWTFVITQREVDRHFRKKHPQSTDPEALDWNPDPNDSHPAQGLANAEALKHLEDCVAQLRDMERKYLQGHLIRGLTFRQSAASNGISLGQFKHRYEKALQQVRECMKTKGHDF